MNFKFLRRFFGFSVVLLLLVLLFSYAFVSVSTRNSVYDNCSIIPFNNIALLPGTSRLMNNGKVNLFFTYRCDAVEELWKVGKIANIIISGDSANSSYDEPEWMRQELLSRGLPDSILILDKKGFNTRASLEFCKHRNINQLTVVSQRFHNERALVISENMGMDAVGYNAEPVFTTYGIRVMIREWFARVKVLFELVFIY
jgi:SanA protein